MLLRFTASILCLLACLAGLQGQEPSAGPRPIHVDDLFAIKRVGDPQFSPDSGWVAYTVSESSLEGDSSETSIWMASTSDGAEIRMTRKGSSRQPATLEPGRQVSVLPIRAPGTRISEFKPVEWISSVAARPPRRRGPTAHQHRTGCARTRMVARREAACAPDQRPRNRGTVRMKRRPRRSPNPG